MLALIMDRCLGEDGQIWYLSGSAVPIWVTGQQSWRRNPLLLLGLWEAQDKPVGLDVSLCLDLQPLGHPDFEPATPLIRPQSISWLQ